MRMCHPKFFLGHCLFLVALELLIQCLHQTRLLSCMSQQFEAVYIGLNQALAATHLSFVIINGVNHQFIVSDLSLALCNIQCRQLLCLKQASLLLVAPLASGVYNGKYSDTLSLSVSDLMY